MITVKLTDGSAHRFDAYYFTYGWFGNRLKLYTTGKELVAVFKRSAVVGFWEN